MQAKSSREYHVVGGLLQRAIPKREITLGVSPLDTAQCLLNCGTQHTNDDRGVGGAEPDTANYPWCDDAKKEWSRKE